MPASPSKTSKSTGIEDNVIKKNYAIDLEKRQKQYAFSSVERNKILENYRDAQGFARSLISNSLDLERSRRVGALVRVLTSHQ